MVTGRYVQLHEVDQSIIVISVLLLHSLRPNNVAFRSYAFSYSITFKRKYCILAMTFLLSFA